VRAEERRRGGGRSHRYEVLTPPLPGLRAEVSLHSLAPGASTAGPDDPPMHEPGSRETAVVKSGPVRFVCGGASHHLDEGDSVTFDADLPHHFENPGDGEARFYAVVAAGLRRS
ncbi:MAG TPA: cupin domain-containing protein, partial [Solirubrobacteraceae bacterium]|nr:cupin domain-containing protein [Solirubrobacteraceae bacterium]